MSPGPTNIPRVRSDDIGLTEQIATLAYDDGPSISPGAFITTDFLRSWNQNTPEDVILTPLFSELGIKQVDNSKLPLDIFLHQALQEYNEQRKAKSSEEIDELEFAGASLVRATSSYARAFQEFKRRVHELRGLFVLDSALDMADSFGQFVIAQAIEQSQSLPPGA